MAARPRKPCVLVFSGLDPSGGAGMTADITAICAMGAHPLSVVTALTVQDNDKVFAVNPVGDAIIRHQAKVLTDKIFVSAVKVGIVGNRENAEAIGDVIDSLRRKHPEMPVVIDTVLGSGLGHRLTDGSPEFALSPLIPKATVITPNLPEAKKLYPAGKTMKEQADWLLAQGAKTVLIKGGHGEDPDTVENVCYTAHDTKTWRFTRLAGEFHGTGCTLASAIAGRLALGDSVTDAIEKAQTFTAETLKKAYAVADGQLIPDRY